MDHGFIATVGSETETAVQMSVASVDVSGMPVPAISAEVDDLEPVLRQARPMEAIIASGPVSEPWAVRRFYLRDPAGSLVNILSHG
jgi:catechol 2,3-dioxygenase-like lactoylglutathione lyase family enzyme